MNAFMWWTHIDYSTYVYALLFLLIWLDLLWMLWRTSTIRMFWKVCHSLAPIILLALFFKVADGSAGYPTREALPDKFYLHGVVIVANDETEKGYIVLSVVEQLEDTREMPRAHILPYSEELEKMLKDAQAKANREGHNRIEGKRKGDSNSFDDSTHYEFEPVRPDPGPKD